MGFTIPNAADATYTAQARVFQADIDQLSLGFSGKDGIFSGMSITAAGGSLTVNSAAGTFIYGGTPYDVASDSVTLGAADPTNPRIDIVYYHTTNTLSVVAGTAAADPVAPAVPSTGPVLAFVYVPATATTLAATNITDKRIMYDAATDGGLLYVDGTNGDNDGDGLTWETAYATLAAANTTATGGETILLRGTTTETGAITLTNDINIYGFGWEASTITAPSGTTFITCARQHIIKNLKIATPTDPTVLIDMNTSSYDIYLERVELEGASSAQVDTDGCVRFHIIGCYFNNDNSGGKNLLVGGGEGFVIGNNFKTTAAQCIDENNINAGPNIYANNRFQITTATAGDYGIDLANTNLDGTLIIGNHFFQPYIAVYSPASNISGLIIADNYINDPVNRGIQLSQVRNTTIVGNNIYDPGGEGIYVQSQTNESANLIANNLIRGNANTASRGIYATVGTWVIRNNVIDNVDDFPINCGASDHLSIIGNVMTARNLSSLGPVTRPITVIGAGYVIIRDNSVFDGGDEYTNKQISITTATVVDVGNNWFIDDNSSKSHRMDEDYARDLAKDVTSATTLDRRHGVVKATTSTAAFNITLPDATDYTGVMFVVQRSGATYSVGVVRSGTDNIYLDGTSQTSVTLGDDGASVSVYSDGSNWYVAGKNGTVT